MSHPFIVLGDATTHGGTVISADFTTDIHGKYMARVGDMTVCPRCKGVFPITSGAPEMVDGAGNCYARHMDATACGAKLISSQIFTTWSNASAMGESAAVSQLPILSPDRTIAATTDSGICLDCLLKAALIGSPVVVRE